MVRFPTFLLSFLLFAVVIFCELVHAEVHRATFLGNPATRFAPPLFTENDLRARFSDAKLRPDFADVLRQWGWKGNLDDLHRAALTTPIEDISIAIGETMPFMSSRKNGKPICLRNVIWEGTAPAPAYAFNFISNGRKYRCITPKACSNFFVVDQGPVPVAGLSIACLAPGEALPGRPFDVCFTVQNPGDGVLPEGVLRLQIPENARLFSTEGGETNTAGFVIWNFTNLAAKMDKKFCAKFSSPEPGVVTFAASASGPNVNTALSSCPTKIIGIPAILIDAVDMEDPVEVENDVTYEIKVTNQGSSEATNVRLVFILPPNEEFISGGGPSRITSEEGIKTEPLPILAPKGVATWKVVVKAKQPGDVRFKIELSSDQFTKPIREEESTLLY